MNKIAEMIITGSYREPFRVIQYFTQKFRLSIMLVTNFPNSRKYIRRIYSAWTISATISTLVTQPDICIPDQFVFHSPTCPNHFFSWKRLVIRSK